MDEVRHGTETYLPRKKEQWRTSQNHLSSASPPAPMPARC